MDKPVFNHDPKQTIAIGTNDSNETANAKKSKKLNSKVAGGAVAGAAVLGVGGTAAAMSLADGDEDNEIEEIDLDAQAEEIEIGADDDFNPNTPDANSSLNGMFHTNLHPAHTSSDQQSTPSANNGHEAHNETNQSGTDNHININDTNDGTISADEVIALTEIDSNDNDMPELLTFENVELIQEPDGDVHLHAEFTVDGERYTMVDIDNDGVFDTVEDSTGTVQGGAAGMMLSDIELISNENNTNYLAANDLDNNSNISGTGESAIDDNVII